jgi:uncharacterized protein GlcG (DUF336 family)
MGLKIFYEKPVITRQIVMKGIGVSGGSEEEDMVCAESALAVLTKVLNQ